LSNKHNTDHLLIQTHNEISRLSICNEGVPHNEELPLSMSSENLTLIDDNSDPDKDHGQ